MNTITVATLDVLDPGDLLAIRSRLTRPQSEFQIEVSRVMAGDISSITPVALWHVDGALVAWACSHVWKDFQTLEQFTDPQFRRRGIATGLSAALVGAGVLDIRQPVAVFSATTEAVARRLWAVEVVRFERVGSEWVHATPPPG